MKYFVFDVESAGLNGAGFAFGYVVVDENGKELDSAFATSGIDSVAKDLLKDDRDWLEVNLPEAILHPKGNFKLTREELKIAFKSALKKHEGAVVVSDCGYPVEVRWLSDCECSVYPLHELATAMLLCGKNPVANYARRASEMPKHHPLADARQSARLWSLCLKRLQKRSKRREYH